MQATTAPPSAKQLTSRAQIFKNARQLHLWLGTFFAPAILFFAFSGALQTFGLHEAARGEPYKPPVWITKLAQLHKKQNLETKPPSPPQAKATVEATKPRQENRPAPKPPKPATFAFKIFTGLMAVGLIFTTLLGLFMSFQFGRDKRITWVLLILGTVVPLGMVLFM